MVRSVYIRLLSCLLLIVFALSITPKKYLHNAFAKHSDNRIAKQSNGQCQLTNLGFNCDSDNLVAESCFIVEQHYFEHPFQQCFSTYVVKNISFSFTRKIYSSLRGPPVSI